MNVTKGFRRVPQFEDAYRDLFKHELHKLPNRQMVALFDSFDNVIGRPFDQMNRVDLGELWQKFKDFGYWLDDYTDCTDGDCFW